MQTAIEQRFQQLMSSNLADDTPITLSGETAVCLIKRIGSARLHAHSYPFILNQPRLHALFDFTNMINAGERPLTALHTLAPIMRQVHRKGAKWLKEGGGRTTKFILSRVCWPS